MRQKQLSEMPAIPHLSEAGNARQGFVLRMELDRLLVHLPEYLRDMVLFAYLSSWRRGEIVSLTWDGVHGDVIRLRADIPRSGRRVVWPSMANCWRSSSAAGSR